MLQVVDGPLRASGRSRQVIAYYGEGAQVASMFGTGDWYVGTVTAGTITPTSPWPNDCESFGTSTYDGLLVEATAYATEDDARRAFGD